MDPEAAAAARRAQLTFGLLVLASLVALAQPLPLQLAALAFAVGALVAGTRAVLASRRAGTFARVGPILVLGLALTATTAMSVVSAAIVYDLAYARQECLRHALTTSALETCETTFRDDVQERLDRLVERAGTPRR